GRDVYGRGDGNRCRARAGHGGGGRRPETDEDSLRDGWGDVPCGAITSSGCRADHHRALAGISERYGEPRDRARDPGRGPDAGPRLAVRAAAVRARAVEQHERGSVSLRSAPHHRQRPAPPARTAAGQPRSAVGHGADCGSAGGRWAEQAVAARNGGTRLWTARGSIAGSGGEGREALVGTRLSNDDRRPRTRTPASVVLATFFATKTR